MNYRSGKGKQVHEDVALVAETGKALDRIAGQVSEVNNIVSAIARSARNEAAAPIGAMMDEGMAVMKKTLDRLP